MSNTFSQGTVPGSLNSAADIKLLLVYLANEYNTRIGKDQLVDCLCAQEIANYFEISAAISSLSENEQVAVDEHGCLITAKNWHTISPLFDTIPASVLTHAKGCIDDYIQSNQREKPALARIIKVSDGFLVKCMIPDLGSDLFSTTLFAPTMEEAQLMKENFLKDYKKLYQLNLGLLTGQTL